MNEQTTKEVVLLIADISGYTEFMVSSDLEIEHSQHVITQLIQAIIREVEIPLEVSKLEGDAIFLYAVKGPGEHTPGDVGRRIGEKLILFFESFHSKRAEFDHKGQCDCGACTNTRVLKLKIVVHSGQAHFYRIHDFNELSGGDVILVHRLLKNSVAHEEYILMTEPAWSDIRFPQHIEIEEGCEHYPHLGDVKTLVFNPRR